MSEVPLSGEDAYYQGFHLVDNPLEGESAEIWHAEYTCAMYDDCYHLQTQFTK